MGEQAGDPHLSLLGFLYLFFFFNFKGKGCLGSLRGISQHLVSSSKLHSWSVNIHAATAKEALRLREEI